MAIDLISKEETISGLTISTFPHLTENRRTQVFNELRRSINIGVDRNTGIVKSYAEVISNLKKKLGLGNGR